MQALATRCCDLRVPFPHRPLRYLKFLNIHPRISSAHPSGYTCHCRTNTFSPQHLVPSDNKLTLPACLNNVCTPQIRATKNISAEMLLGKEPQFVRRLGSIWDSVIHITNLDTLRECMMNSILVAFDIEGHVASINEVGMAYLHVSEAKPLRASQDGTLRTFHSQNAIQAYTIMVWEMRSKRRHEAIKYGDHVTVHRDVVCETLDQTLSSVEQRSRQLILVGYDMYTEFDWISRENPTFLSRFKYWVDVQELVEASCGSRPSHFNTMAAMNITDWNPTNSPPSGHRASNDAVRALATLSTLVSLGKFEYQRVVATRLFSSSPRNWDNYPFKARVTTRDKDMLPACIKTPRALSSHFAAYEPVAVLINKRAATKGVRVWWICVPTRDLLEKLAADMNGSVLGGKELNIEKVIASWIADRQGRQHQGIKSAASDRTHLQQNFEMEDFEIDI